MDIGGVERSLIGLLEALSTEKLSVDLFMMKHGGQFEKYIPKWVNVLPENKACASLTTPGIETLKKGQLLYLLKRVIAKASAARFVRKNRFEDNQIYLTYSHKFMSKHFPKLGNERPYDLAISFLGPHYLGAYKVNAKKKVAWIHTDYSQIGLDREADLKTYKKFDYLVGVSESVCQSFIQIFPELKERVQTIENILPVNMIYQSARQKINSPYKADELNLLSIGRFCYAKNFENIPMICSNLQKSGLNFHWYLIGYGGMEKAIRDQIRIHHMEDKVTILGKKDNPYPYLSRCDVYLQPSRYEGCAVSVREAQLFNKPVIISKFNTAGSQVNDGVDGLVLSLDSVQFANELRKILNNSELLTKIANGCKLTDHSNRSEVKKVLAMLD